MIDAETIAQAKHRAEICRIFGSPNRVLIIWALGDQEMTVSEIAEEIDASLQNTSQHLRLMKDKHILMSRRVGNAIYYRVRQDTQWQDCEIIAQALQDSLSNVSD